MPPFSFRKINAFVEVIAYPLYRERLGEIQSNSRYSYGTLMS